MYFFSPVRSRIFLLSASVGGAPGGGIKNTRFSQSSISGQNTLQKNVVLNQDGSVR